MHRRHRPVRSWWSPWRVRCACGCRWYPCPDGRPNAPDPSGEQVAQALNERPEWTAPTQMMPNVTAQHLRTPAQRWRGQGGRWQR